MAFRADSEGISAERTLFAGFRHHARRCSSRYVACLIGGCLLLAGVFITQRVWSIEGLVRHGRVALRRGDAAEAQALAQSATARAPHSIAAWRLLAEAAEDAKDPSQAIFAMTQLTERDRPNAANWWMRIGGLEMKRLRIREAESALARALAVDARQAGALRLRAQLMGVLGRSQEMAQALVQLIRCEAFTLDDLVVLAAVDPFISDPALVDSMLEANPDEVLPLLAKARLAVNENRADEAQTYLNRILAKEPTLWEAQALLGEILAERPGDEFLRWQNHLPPDAETHSRIWLTRGLWLRSRGDLEHAARCFWETLLREPEMVKATLQLGRTLALYGELELGGRFLQRGKLLQQISSLAARIDERKDLSLAGPLVADLEEAGRVWEAWAWCSLQAQAAPRDEVIANRLARLAERLSPDLPRTVPNALPGRSLDWSRAPLPDWTTYQTEKQTADNSGTPAEIHFVDEARRVGLDFEFVNNDPTIPERRIFESTGGGVAAFDFDGDGWTDLYFAQGGIWPVVPGKNSRDALYRNDRGLRFENVTDHSGIVEEGFSQGVSAGDFDDDGFPDLYVANIGRNRLFHNNGDGTFTDATVAAGLTDEVWTVSCAIADINGDGFPDLFDVNYLQGDKIFTTVCVDDRGETHVCRPTVFEAADDCVAVSRGDGTFSILHDEAGLKLPNGMGLGLIVADFNSDRRPDVFVANDQMPNYLLLNAQPDPAGPLKFEEQGHVQGVALDRDGFARACMGIASADINRDGRLDLFVTTFAQETKILYLSQADGSYLDGTREAGLRAPTFELLGFGTQFLDADLDGWPDLLILNGHIDDFGSSGPEYRMRPQIFRGLPGPRFVELTAGQAGEFFGIKRVGRGLATLDWNRDRVPDFIATYLAGPVALGTNRTPAAGRSLCLKLVGTKSSRDAIGARLRIVPAEGEERYFQMTAGDGYEACNERIVRMGLGARERVERVEIDWPSGQSSVFENVACRGLWLAVEGSPRLKQLESEVP